MIAALKRKLKSSLKPWAYRILAQDGARPFFGQFSEDACLYSYFANKSWHKYHSHLRIDAGFYVDVGAHHPVSISNTYAFYLQGWRGINIDATPGSMNRFAEMRPGDINLSCAVSDKEGLLKFFVFEGASVYNTLDVLKAQSAAQQLGIPYRTVDVPVRRLASILEEHLPFNQAIDFLSVDVEGQDLAVLRSNDWSRIRPELVVVELHVTTIEEAIKSDLTLFMQSVDYQIRFWTPPSIIYMRN
jgi:FkbM family methyltransferase